MNANDIFPNVKTKTLHIKEKKKIYSYPSNFLILNKKSFNLIYKHFNQGQAFDINKLSYEVLIFGQCIIIKSHLNPCIIYVSIFKENNANGTNYED